MLRVTRCTPVLASCCASSDTSTKSVLPDAAVRMILRDRHCRGNDGGSGQCLFVENGRGGCDEIVVDSRGGRAGSGGGMKASRSALIALLALASQENCRARARCRATSSARNSSSVRTRCSLLAMSSMEYGSNMAASKPTTSGMLVVLEAMTGAPHCIASSAGKPNPSWKLGNTKALHIL